MFIHHMYVHSVAKIKSIKMKIKKNNIYIFENAKIKYISRKYPKHTQIQKGKGSNNGRYKATLKDDI